ncbi:YydG family radical SAM peptide epimerase [Enterococcus rotai]|uniref:YydG family radical SAM peptide epimerase n=1 Tax=Enterococcus rotai TaxID=118060 RepID=UPI0032B326AF
MEYLYESVVVNLGARCNATCEHCCFSCSPSKKDSLGKSEIIELVKNFSKNMKVKVISFTGGEIFLNYSFLKELLEIVHLSGKKSTLITNGFWGESVEKVRLYFKDMKKLGVTNLAISHDDFHAKFVKTESIKNILEESRKHSSIQVVVNIAVSQSNMGNQIIDTLEKAALGIPLTKFPLISVGEAENMDDSEFQKIYSIDHAEQLECPGYEPVYHFDGNVYPCCSPAVFDTALILNEEPYQSFDKTIEKMNSNLLLYIMRKEGFKWFIEIVMSNQEFSHMQIEEKFSSICTICRQLFKTEENIKLFTPYMREYYEQML